jgi:putative ABC transport system permease protein
MQWLLNGQAQQLRIAGTVAASGAPVAVMDIAALQQKLGLFDRIDRLDLLLTDSASRSQVATALHALPAWQDQVLIQQPSDDQQRVGEMSRAYRVNLTVLALVALFTGAFLVFSVLALSVAQRAPQFALLAVLGATPRQRMALVLLEALALGTLGSLAGIALGTALAWLALQVLGGDLGGGFFAGVQPALHWSPVAALVFGLLGLAATLAGAWWPARAAMDLPPAATLKGLGSTHERAPRLWPLWRCLQPAWCWPLCHRWQVSRWRPIWPWACCCWAACQPCPGCWVRCWDWYPRPSRASRWPCWRWSARGACATPLPWPWAAWWPA